MKMKTKTEITPERLRSMGFKEISKDNFEYYDIPGIILIFVVDMSHIEIKKGDNVIPIFRMFNYMESIKEFLTGLTGKKDFRR